MISTNLLFVSVFEFVFFLVVVVVVGRVYERNHHGIITVVVFVIVCHCHLLATIIICIIKEIETSSH